MPQPESSRPSAPQPASGSGTVGVWLFGALGTVATHVVTGARALARGLSPTTGLVTAGEPFFDLPLCRPADLVFGGHDLRSGSPLDAARDIVRRGGGLPPEIVEAVAGDLDAFGDEIRTVRPVGVGAWSKVLGVDQDPAPGGGREQVARVAADLRSFRARHALDTLVAVNLTSTEPLPPALSRLESADDPEALLDLDRAEPLPSSVLSSLGAIEAGCAMVDFTPSRALTLPAVQKAAVAAGVPICGRDGKTGETLLKSVLGPMFLLRNLRVLSWESTNLLGNRDGLVLDHPDNRASKLCDKTQGLNDLLGYPLHHRAHIHYVPSLDDWKTAWNLVHFEGFLRTRMMLQLTWQGCDSALAAPLVLDLVRLCELAIRRGEIGVMRHTAAFFKAPLAGGSFDLASQAAELLDYARRVREGS